MLKNIKHLTVTTGNIVTYPDNSVILDIAKPAISAMVNRAKINGFAPVIDNTIVECNINYDLGAYEATLYADKTKKIPLLFTCGTVNECASDYIWDIINNKYHEIYGTCCPKTQIPHLLQSFVFDTSSGKLCSIRGLKLSNKMSRKLYQMIENQRKLSFNLAQYDRNLYYTYNKYSTKDMLKMTSDYFKLR